MKSITAGFSNSATSLCSAKTANPKIACYSLPPNSASIRAAIRSMSVPLISMHDLPDRRFPNSSA